MNIAKFFRTLSIKIATFSSNRLASNFERTVVKLRKVNKEFEGIISSNTKVIEADKERITTTEAKTAAKVAKVEMKGIQKVGKINESIGEGHATNDKLTEAIAKNARLANNIEKLILG